MTFRVIIGEILGESSFCDFDQKVIDFFMSLEILFDLCLLSPTKIEVVIPINSHPLY